MKAKIKLELTEKEIASLLDIISTIEAMQGGSEECHDLNDWDTQMSKQIKTMDKMFKRNGYKR